MKLFHFYRSEDLTGISGTGPIVEGVQFTNGWCALRWVTEKSSICFYQSIEEVKSIHGHGGKTEIIVHDLDPLMKKTTSKGSERFEILMQIIEETSHFNVISEDAAQESIKMIGSIKNLRILIDLLERSIPQKYSKIA